MHNTTKRLTESAIMVALATVLSMVQIVKLQNGGSVTAASMVPIIFIALRNGTSWGLLTSVVYAGMQMLIGFYPPPTPNFISFAAVVMLDYVIAFGGLGLAPLFAKLFGKKKVLGAAVATACVCVLRFVAHYLSGLIIWGSGDPSVPAWLFSLTYNGSYMLPETIISVIVVSLLVKYVKIPE
ncbi:energy-coupled thiamine transporter ThiT [Acidaminobacterium chupaoyuni]